MSKLKKMLILCFVLLLVNVEMDPLRTRPALHGALRVLNQRENRDLQLKLNLLDKQYKYTRKMLQQRRASLMSEERKVVMVKYCEPIATVNIAMKEIQEHVSAETHFSRDIHTAGGRLTISESGADQTMRPEVVEKSRSISAPPLSVQPSRSVRRRGNIQSSLSFRQMKSIATIDSISEKERARQQKEAREEVERLRQLQRETLQNRVTAFIEMLKEKRNMEIIVEPT